MHELVSAFASRRHRSGRFIHRYIAVDNPAVATRFIGELFDLFHLLAKNPQMGQLRDDLRPDLRSMSHGNYVVFFYPIERGIEVASVVHGARDIETLFREDPKR